MQEFLESLFAIAIVVFGIMGFWNHWYWLVPGLILALGIYDKIRTAIETDKFLANYVPPVYVPIELGMSRQQVRNNTEFGCYILDNYLTQTLTAGTVKKEYMWNGGKLVFENEILTEIKQWNTW